MTPEQIHDALRERLPSGPTEDIESIVNQFRDLITMDAGGLKRLLGSTFGEENMQTYYDAIVSVKRETEELENEPAFFGEVDDSAKDTKVGDMTGSLEVLDD